MDTTRRCSSTKPRGRRFGAPEIGHGRPRGGSRILRGRRRRGARASQRGFTLIAVVLVLAVLLGGLLAVLHDAGLGFREHGQARAKEIVAGAMEHGLSQAMDQIQIMDPFALVDSSNNWDIFANWGNETFTCPNPPCGASDVFTYPPAGPYANELSVRVGLSLGQRTRAPAGEDVNNAYGYVVEVQLAVWKGGNDTNVAERASVGVRLPQIYSHSN